jgi:hypothetical protein
MYLRMRNIPISINERGNLITVVIDYALNPTVKVYFASSGFEK